MTPLFFTLEEANQLIPELERLFKRLEEKRETYAREHDLLFMHELITHAERQDKPQAASDEAVDDGFRDLEKAIVDLEKDLQAIRQLGCIVRNLEAGTVEFPACQKDGKIFYCWTRGEKRILFYRLPESLWEDRQPIS